MRLYQATRFLFPRSFERRILFICFGAVHVPLLACVAFQALTGGWEAATLIVLLIATLASTTLGLMAISSLLAPIAKATAMLESIQQGQRITEMPANLQVGGEDVVGQLLRTVTLAANEAADRVETLTDAAERDHLTGLRNRRGFLDATVRALTGEYSSVLALIDLDHFKSINDSFGHPAGDELLQIFSERLSTMTRSSDITARWGGEEFAVLFPDTTLVEARAVMERLRHSVTEEDPLLIGDRMLTFSCGLAPVGNHSLLGVATRRADAALYMAKHDGRNQIQAAY